MIHVVAMKCLVGLPLLIHIELLWRSRSRSFKNRRVGVGAFVYRLHSSVLNAGGTGIRSAAEADIPRPSAYSRLTRGPTQHLIQFILLSFRDVKRSVSRLKMREATAPLPRRFDDMVLN
jgi:hypothetical protein